MASERRATKDGKRFGHVIRAARIERGISQERLAKLTRTDPGNMSLIEQGKVLAPWPRMKRIARALGLPAWELYRRVEEWGSAPPRSERPTNPS